MKYCIIVIIILFSNLIFSKSVKAETDTATIQLALILDNSSSMNGLINQTQGQLWNLVNLLSLYKKNDVRPKIEFALIVYGDGTKVLSKFTTNIDQISEKLFNIPIEGGEEYCAEAINTSLNTLAWSTKKEDLKIIIIAGNESFNQKTSLPYDSIAALVSDRDIRLNTIFCGDAPSGKELLWESAAIIGGGRFTNINQDLQIKREETPFDNKIIQLYEQYKATYVFYGDSATIHYRRIQEQDRNIQLKGKSFYRERIIYKLRFEPPKPYDLIDVYPFNSERIDTIPRQDLPEVFQKMSHYELEQFLLKRQLKREFFKDAIKVYANQVKNYYDTIYKKETTEKTLETAIQEIVEAQLREKAFRADIE